MKRLFALIITLLPLYLWAQETVIYLSGHWRLYSPDTGISITATIPGNVFLDLTCAGVIPDPFYGNNEQKVQWVSRTAWTYEKSIYLTGGFLHSRHIELVFKGLYPFARVYVNGHLVIVADNMFRRWQADIGHLLHKGQNVIKVEFTPPIVEDSILARNFPHRLPDERVFARSAAYQYGWDWGARLVPVGIWQDAYLIAWDRVRINDFFVRLDTFDRSLAQLSAIVDISTSHKTNAEISILDQGQKLVLARTKLRLYQGNNHIIIPFYLAAPRLWWPRGMGEPYLYHIRLNIHGKGFSADTVITTGLRRVELVQDSDSIGRSFYLRINGQRVFARGANYIPPDQFPSRVTDSQYQTLLNDVARANINMLRVWGGGLYERDRFYDLCDSLGIMVWQDFMFACYLYPFDNDFIKNVHHEAVYQVRRLRRHPGIALWCGNNEVKEAWFNWGYQKLLSYSAKDSIAVWHGQMRIFDSLLPAILDSLLPDVPYIPSSPQTGWGHREAYRMGDLHYWGVWWGKHPFEAYRSHVGRFVSEYGFQAFPDLRTLEAVVPDSGLSLDSPALLNHQKHPYGMQLIRSYMERYFGLPDDFDEYLYYSQLTQAYGIGMAIEAHRTAKPRCMGTLYWQLNDSWPVISWSSRDYYGRWKALMYEVRRLYKTVIITGQKHDNDLDLYVVSDSLSPIRGQMILQLWSTDGQHRIAVDTMLTVFPDTSQRIISLNLSDIDTVRQFLVTLLLDQNKDTVAEKVILLARPRDLHFTPAHINMNTKKQRGHYVISLSADRPVAWLWLESSEKGFFSDNLLWLLPGQTYNVTFHPRSRAQVVKFSFRYYK